MDDSISDGEWLSESVEAKKNSNYFALDKLDWGHSYKLELYAGNRFGVGKPCRRRIRREYGKYSGIY